MTFKAKHVALRIDRQECRPRAHPNPPTETCAREPLTILAGDHATAPAARSSAMRASERPIPRKISFVCAPTASGGVNRTVAGAPGIRGNTPCIVGFQVDVVDSYDATAQSEMLVFGDLLRIVDRRDRRIGVAELR